MSGEGYDSEALATAAVLREFTHAWMIAAMNAAEPEPVISREEVMATMFLIADIASEARTIRILLEDDGEEEEKQEGTG